MCGGAGAEAYFYFTLTATSDVFLATHQTVGITFIPAGTTSISGTILGYTNDYTDAVTTGCTYTSAREDRVYYFYLPASQSVTFDGCAGVGSRFDEIIYVRSVCTDAALGNQVVCNDDDACGGNVFCDSGKFNAGFTATLGPGLYFFFADGYLTGGSCDTLGNFVYTISGL